MKLKNGMTQLCNEKDSELARYQKDLRKYIITNSAEMTREGKGLLTHPYVSPTSKKAYFYTDSLWDWDSWMASVVFGQVELEADNKADFFKYEQGSILNFLDQTTEEGVMPIQISEGSVLSVELTDEDNPFSQNMHKPVIAQQIAMLVQRKNEAKWIEPYLPTLRLFLERYLESHRHKETGLLYWQSDFAVGVDNDPSLYYRPDASCGSIYLNSLFYRELLGFAYILERLNMMDEAIEWRKKAYELAEVINKYCWDERDKTYYSVDLNLRKVDLNENLHKGAPRHWHSILQRIDNWSSFLPLWAGIASPEQAKFLVKHLSSEETYQANYGIRTLSKLEKMYSLQATNNPSNWLGPVWGLSNYMVFSGLVKYGFDQEATELAKKTVLLFGKDLEKNGCLHEYYHPDTGGAIMTPEFQNWNFLVLQMIAYLENRKVQFEF